MELPKTPQQKVRELMNHWMTETAVAVLIIVSVSLVLIEAALRPADPWFTTVVRTNQVITGIFVLELSLRFYGERRKRNFFRKYWYDILAVMPLFRAARFLRIFRLLRLFRVGVIAIRRLARSSKLFRVVRIEYVVVALIAITVVLMGALSLEQLEPGIGSLERSLWFAAMTVIAGEPVGYDATTRLGRLVTVTMMLGGLTVFAVITGTVSAVMVDTFRKLRISNMTIEDLNDHVVVCGWNQAGPLVIKELLHEDRRFEHIIVVSEREDLDDLPVIQAHPSRVMTVQGDYTRLSVLREVGLERAGYALLLADDSIEGRSSQDRDARTVLAAMLIEKVNDHIYTTVQLLNRDNESSLREIGVEEIIVSDEYVGNIMATVTKNRGIVSMLDELLTSQYGQQFFKDPVPPELVGMTVGDALVRLKEDYNATLLGVDKRPDRTRAERADVQANHASIEVNPPKDLKLEETHHLFVAAPGPLRSRD